MDTVRFQVEAAAIEYKGCIIFCESKMNALFRLHIESGVTELVTFLEREKKIELYRNAFRYKNQAWFIPWEADEILRVDLDTFDMEYYPIPYTVKNTRALHIYPGAVYCSSGRIDEEEIFLVPTGTDTPVVINMRTEEIRTYKNIVDVNEEILWYGTCIGDQIWMAPYDGKRMIVLDRKTGSVESIPWHFDKLQYGGMLFYDHKIWFAPNKADHMLTYEIHSGTYEEIPMGSYYQERFSYWELQYFDDKIWVIPEWSEKILYYDPVSGKWGEILKDPAICFPFLTELRRIESKDSLVLVTCRTGFVSIYEPSRQNFINIPVEMDRKKLRGKVAAHYRENDLIINAYRLEDGTFSENYIGLPDYIQLCSGETEIKGNEKNVGALIWENMKKRSDN